MIATLIQSLQAWLATTSGFMTIAIIISLGLILSFVFAVFTFNMYSQLTKVEREREKFKQEVNSLNVKQKQLEISHKGEIEKLKNGHLSEIEKIKSRHADELKLSQDENLRVTQERSELSGTIANLETKALLDSEQAILTRQRLEDDLHEYSVENSKLRVGTNAWGTILSEAIRKKAVSMATFLFAIELSPENDSGNRTAQVAMINVSDDVNLDVVHADTKFNILELSEAIEKFDPVALIANTHDENLGDNPHFGKLVTPDSSIGWDGNNIDYVKTRLGSAVRALNTPSEEGKIVSPVYMVSILYIGSVKSKLIITDFNTEPTAFNSDAQTEKLARNAFFHKLNTLEIKPRVKSDGAELIVLSKELREAMGGAFKTVEIFNSYFIEEILSPDPTHVPT